MPSALTGRALVSETFRAGLGGLGSLVATRSEVRSAVEYVRVAERMDWIRRRREGMRRLGTSILCLQLRVEVNVGIMVEALKLGSLGRRESAPSFLETRLRPAA